MRSKNWSWIVVILTLTSLASAAQEDNSRLLSHPCSTFTSGWSDLTGAERKESVDTLVSLLKTHELPPPGSISAVRQRDLVCYRDAQLVEMDAAQSRTYLLLRGPNETVLLTGKSDDFRRFNQEHPLNLIESTVPEYVMLFNNALNTESNGRFYILDNPAALNLIRTYPKTSRSNISEHAKCR